MKVYAIISVLLITNSCSTHKSEEQDCIESVLLSGEKSNNQNKPYSNPTLIFGSDFISFLSAIKLSQYGGENQLLNFTSSISKARNDKKAILNYFLTTNLNQQKKLKSVNKIGDNMYQLNYLEKINATDKVESYTVSVENDTCRLVLPI